MDVFKLIEKHGIELHGDIEYFAHLVAEAEREACAKLCEGYDVFGPGTRERFADAIRARGET